MPEGLTEFSEYLKLGLSLPVILIGCELFTNGIEWLGAERDLSEGAVGSVLAAVGTALPETTIPFVAIFLEGGEAGRQVGIGAILGAPFLLGTLAFGVLGIAAVAYARRRPTGRFVRLRRSVVLRDMRYFVAVYGVVALWALRPTAPARLDALKWVLGLLLLAAYYRYVIEYLRRPGDMDKAHGPALRFGWGKPKPSLRTGVVQALVGLAGIVGGARLFVQGVEALAGRLGVSPEVLGLIIAPIATELPEQFNAVLWLRRGRDPLAVGNVTGAMVFQSCIPPALGVCFTRWRFLPMSRHIPAIVSVAAALLSGATLGIWAHQRNRLSGYAFMGALTLYAVFVVVVLQWWRGALHVPG